MTPRRRIAPLLVVVLTAFVSVPMPCFATGPPAPGSPAAVDRGAEVEGLFRQVAAGGEGRKRARAALIALGSEATVHVCRHATSSSHDVRWEVVNVLGYYADLAAVDTLVDRVLTDADGHVRWRAIWALREIPGVDLGDRLRTLLANDNPTTRWRAAVAGSMFEVGEALATLQAGLGSGDALVAWEAVNGLSRIKDPSSVPLLASVVAGGESRLRREAVLSLGNLPYPASRDALLARLADGNPEVRWRVAMVLSSFDDDRVRAALQERLVIETTASVRSQLTNSLQVLRPR